MGHDQLLQRAVGAAAGAGGGVVMASTLLLTPCLSAAQPTCSFSHSGSRGHPGLMRAWGCQNVSLVERRRQGMHGQPPPAPAE